MNQTKMGSRKRRFFAKMPLIILGFVLGALLAEAALRVIGFSFPEFYRADQSRGQSLRPGMEGWYRKEGEAFVRINSDGLRDREHTTTKPANILRIAVVGDSYPEALQVRLEDAFWMVMEQKLNTCGAFAHKQVEVINFGVSGYGTAQELITLREQVWKYEPDVVLLTVTTNNDITDNVRALKRTDQIPYFVHQNGQLVLDESFKHTQRFRFQQSRLAGAGRWARDHSRLIQAIAEAQRALRVLTASWRARFKAASPANSFQAGSDLIARSEELGADNLVYMEAQDPTWREAWAVTEELLLLMHDEVVQKGAKFVVVTLSNGPQVHPDVKVRQDFMQRFLVQDLFYPDHRIKALCDRNGILSFMLAPELQAYADQNQTFLHGFGQGVGAGHWNVTGHRVAGELLAEKICQVGLPK